MRTMKFLACFWALLCFFAVQPTEAQVSPPQSVFSLPGVHCQTPKWAPDGKEVAIELFSPKQDAREIVIVQINDRSHVIASSKVEAEGGAAASLLGGKKPPVVELAWAPDRNLLSKPYIFSGMSERKNFDLFADGAWLTKKNQGNDGQPAWSRDGRYIAYVSQQRESGDIFLIDLQGDIDVPIRITHFSDTTEYRPAWNSKDNTLLFTRSSENGQGQDIGIVSDITASAASTKMVLEWPSDEIRPSFSPNGKMLAFYSNRNQDNKKRFDLWVSNRDGSGAKLLHSDVIVSDVNGPVWLPDSSKLLFVSRDFKNDNPVMWTDLSGDKKGKLETNTQLNSDLDLFAVGDQLRLAVASHGVKGATQKTWRQIFVVNFRASDLK